MAFLSLLCLPLSGCLAVSGVCHVTLAKARNLPASVKGGWPSQPSILGTRVLHPAEASGDGSGLGSRT